VLRGSRTCVCATGYRKQFTAKLDEEFPAKVQLLCQQVYAWVALVESSITTSARYDRDQAHAINQRSVPGPVPAGWPLLLS
jgi:hypothetical protein